MVMPFIEMLAVVVYNVLLVCFFCFFDAYSTISKVTGKKVVPIGLCS